MVKFVTATFWLGKPFCPLPFLSDCWVTISVVMEWNGMETDMAHGLVTMVSTGRSDRVVRWWPMTMMYPPTSSPPTHSYVFVRAYTRPLPRVTRVSALVVVVVDDGVCGDRLTRRPWPMGCGGPANVTSPRPQWDLSRSTCATSTTYDDDGDDDDDNYFVGARRWWPSTTTNTRNTRTCHLWFNQLFVELVNRRSTGHDVWWFFLSMVALSRRYKTEHTGDRSSGPTNVIRTDQTVHSTPLIGSSVGMRRWYRFRRPICRAHDRPPSRTTKTATLFTNPATSWQIDVREYVNTLIVVDFKQASDRLVDRSIGSVTHGICPMVSP